MLEQATLARLERGLRGFASGMIRVVSQFTGSHEGQKVIVLQVESAMSSKTPQTYYVGYKPATGEWQCTCPDYQKRHRPCKHILALQVYHQQRIDA
jgi:hypothetical protein